MSDISAVKRPLPPGEAPGISADLRAAVADAARIKSRAIDRAAYASDASHYLLTPKAVIVAADAAEVAAILRAATSTGERVTFRSGGTSLSGQGISDGVLIDVRQRFRRIEVLDNGARVRVQPGATVRQVNAHLARHNRRLGPDPASEAACTVGGVIADNSSGMACGIEENTYRTLESAVLVLPSGTVIDTARTDARALLGEREPELIDGLLRLQRRVRENPRSVALIRRQFALKNTMGYGINAFLDHEDPVQLLLHLVVGSEGTLAFVAEATFLTVPVRNETATTLAVFPTLRAAASALPALVDSGATTLELMDATSLRVGQSMPAAPQQILGFEVHDEAALLIEYQGVTADELRPHAEAGNAALSGLALRTPTRLSAARAERDVAWKFRKGLYASVAGARPRGTTALLEDIAVPVPALADTCSGLQELFYRHGYGESVIFGHAKDGNIHFMLTDRFAEDRALDRYLAFTEDMVDMVLDAGGNLKAEHGTGRVMAPYVRRQYGEELYDVMRQVKSLCDAAGILNPGVIIDDDPHAHLRHLKSAPVVEAEVDRCVECGYCEPVCPSRDLTLTPRQRIVVRRAHATAVADGDDTLAGSLERDYAYDGIQTCAVDGMCQTACPVLIDTGTLVKRLRREVKNPVLAAGWDIAAKHWGAVTRAGAAMLTVANVLPSSLVRGITDAARAAVGADTVPRYSSELPAGGGARRTLHGTVGSGDDEPMAVYLPSCVNSMFGAAEGGPGATSALVTLAERAGVRLIVPSGIESLCCGTPWSSKGYTEGLSAMTTRVRGAVRSASGGRKLPVISDASSCTEGFARILRSEGFHVVDSVEFAATEILPRVSAEPVVDSLVLHPTCSSRHLELDPQLIHVAEATARTVHVPTDWGCCAYAGDRGMLHPELTAAATRPEAAEVASLQAQAHASCNRTCELAMTRATGHPYQHVLELLERATRGSGREPANDVAAADQ